MSGLEEESLEEKKIVKDHPNHVVRKKIERKPPSVSAPCSPRSSSSTTTPKFGSAPSSLNAILLNQGNKGKRWLKDH